MTSPARLLTIGIILCIAGLMFLGTAAAALPDSIDLKDGNITITVTGATGIMSVTFGADPTTESGVPAGTTINITQTDSATESTSNRILIDGNNIESTPEIKIKINGVNINATNGAAFALTNNTSVSLTLVGDNILKSGADSETDPGRAGLEVPADCSITIDGGGNLEARGGSSTGFKYSGSGAGIGGAGGKIGENGQTSGNITIQTTGKIKAYGADGSGGGPIGIGGAGSGIGGGGGGCGDGNGENGGDGGSAMQITITCNFLIVTGGDGKNGAGAGSGIGGGGGGYSGNGNLPGNGGNGGSATDISIISCSQVEIKGSVSGIGGGNGGEGGGGTSGGDGGSVTGSISIESCELVDITGSIGGGNGSEGGDGGGDGGNGGSVSSISIESCELVDITGSIGGGNGGDGSGGSRNGDGGNGGSVSSISIESCELVDITGSIGGGNGGNGGDGGGYSDGGDGGILSLLTITGENANLVISTGGIGGGKGGGGFYSGSTGTGGTTAIQSGNVQILGDDKGNTVFKDGVDGNLIYPIVIIVNDGENELAGVKVKAGNYGAFTNEDGKVSMWLPKNIDNEKTDFKFSKDLNEIERSFAVTTPESTYKVNFNNPKLEFTIESPIYVQLRENVDISFKTTIDDLSLTLVDGTGIVGSGLTYSEGTLSGTAGNVGEYTLKLTVDFSDEMDDQPSVTKEFTIVIWDFETKKLPYNKFGKTYSEEIKIAGGSGTYSFEITAKGTELNDLGFVLGENKITGTAEETGSVTFTIKGTDTGSGLETAPTMTQELTLTVWDFETKKLPFGKIDETYSETIKIGGGSGKYYFELTDETVLEDTGLELTEDGEIKGTPLKAGTLTFEVKVMDTETDLVVSPTMTQKFRLQVWGFETEELTDGIIRRPYDAEIKINAGEADIGYTFDLSEETADVLENIGLKLSEDGKISGTPNKLGKVEFVVIATDAEAENTMSKTFEIKIVNPPKGSGFGQAAVVDNTNAANENDAGSDNTGTDEGFENKLNSPSASDNSSNNSSNNSDNESTAKSDGISKTTWIVIGGLLILVVAGVIIYWNKK